MINNKKALLCSGVFLQRSAKTLFSINAQLRTELNLCKYFPKYINHLQIPVKTASTISKIKRTKILHSFQGPSNTGIQARSKNLQRTWLYNKEKHIYQISAFRYTKSLVQDIKAFSGLRTLFLRDPICSYSNPALQFPYLQKICQIFRVLVNLKQLSLKIDCEQYLHTISKINSCQKVLASLETLKVFFHCSALSAEAKLFKQLLMYKNILKAITHLDMTCNGSEISNEICAELLKSCQKLTYLNFREIRKGNDKYILTPTEALSCFPALKNLSNLRTLKIRGAQTWPFLRDFALPPCIQNVELDFLPFKNPTSVSNEKDLPQILMDFCEKWNDANLNSLKIQFRQKSDNTDLITLFVQQWFRRIKSIQTLSVQLSPQSLGGFGSLSSQKTKELDFSAFLESIEHLENSLKSLTLFDGQMRNSIKNLPEKPLGLYSLQNFTLEGPTISDLNRFFEVILRDLISLEKEEPFEIVLKGQIFDSMESFKSFVQIFDQANFGKRTLIVCIQAHIKSQSAIESSMQVPNKSFSFKLSSKNTTLKFKVTTKQEFMGNENFKAEFVKSLQVLELEEASHNLFF